MAQNILQDWGDKVSSSELSPDPKHSPHGDEVWAQRCHELDYQVSLEKMLGKATH